MKRLNFHRIAEKWYLYAIWAVIVISVWSVVFSLLTAVKPEKKLSLFIASYTCEQDELYDRLNGERAEYLKEFDIMWVTPQDMYFGIYYATYGRQDADILIIPESKLETMIISRDFLRLDENYVKSLYGDVEYFREDGNAYGIKVFDKDKNSGCATDYVGYTREDYESENYYLFFNKDSLHLGGLINSDMDAAIKTAGTFIGL